MQRFFAAGAAALALSLASQPVLARDLPAGGLTREDVAGWLRARGMAANIHKDSHGESIVTSRAADVNFDVYFYACEHERCASLQYAAGWTPASKYTLERVNQWNKDKRFFHAYLDESSNLWGEYDIDISPGGTWEQMDQTLTRWQSQVAAFKTFFNG